MIKNCGVATPATGSVDPVSVADVVGVAVALPPGVGVAVVRRVVADVGLTVGVAVGVPVTPPPIPALCVDVLAVDADEVASG